MRVVAGVVGRHARHELAQLMVSIPVGGLARCLLLAREHTFIRQSSRPVVCVGGTRTSDCSSVLEYIDVMERGRPPRRNGGGGGGGLPFAILSSSALFVAATFQAAAQRPSALVRHRHDTTPHKRPSPLSIHSTRQRCVALPLAVCLALSSVGGATIC
jgi:hypothetical protein